jgi:hypothetical protein
MSKVCIQCREVVTGNNINPNYGGIAIHYGQDWYCGPVVEIAEDVLETTIAHLEAEAKYQASVEDYAVEHSVQRTVSKQARFARYRVRSNKFSLPAVSR